MSTLAQRQLSIVAAALLAVIIGLAVASRDAKATKPVARTPRPAVTNVRDWYTGLAGVRTRPLAGNVSGCRTLLSPSTLGVGHSVLPCGAKLFLAFRGTTVVTTVVDRGPFAPGHDFEVTPGLADILGLSGVQTIRWTFARS